MYTMYIRVYCLFIIIDVASVEVTYFDLRCHVRKARQGKDLE